MPASRRPLRPSAADLLLPALYIFLCRSEVDAIVLADHNRLIKVATRQHTAASRLEVCPVNGCCDGLPIHDMSVVRNVLRGTAVDDVPNHEQTTWEVSDARQARTRFPCLMISFIKASEQR